MKKPPGLTKEQWAKYQKAVDLAIDTMSKSLDLIAEANFRAGEINERERIIKLLEGYALQKCDDLCAYQCECYGKFEAKGFIALIKGEQK